MVEGMEQFFTGKFEKHVLLNARVLNFEQPEKVNRLILQFMKKSGWKCIGVTGLVFLEVFPLLLWF